MSSFQRNKEHVRHVQYSFSIKRKARVKAIIYLLKFTERKLTNTRSRFDQGQPSTSTEKPNRLGNYTMHYIWWGQRGIVYHELLKSGDTVNTVPFPQRMINLNHALIQKRAKCASRHEKEILLSRQPPLSNTVKTLIDTNFIHGW